MACIYITIVIFAFTIDPIRQIGRKRIGYLFNNIDEDNIKDFLIVGLINFISLWMIITVFHGQYGLKVVAAFLINTSYYTSVSILYQVVRNHRNINYLRQEVYTDNLTGIKNRGGLFIDTEDLMISNSKFSLIYMDLDNFKSINDNFGHTEGDKYLMEFASSMKDILGSKGELYRIAGDEFVCTYMGSNFDDFIENLDHKIIERFSGPVPFYGVSIGTASFPKDSINLEQLITSADKRMYRSKKLRTNTTV